MRIAVIGAGAVGGYFGGRLLQAGNEVSFVARGSNLRALRESGLRIESAKGNFATRELRATDDARELAGIELALIAVKTYQLAEALPVIAACVSDATTVLPLLNGVEAPDQLAAALGRARVVGGWASINARLREPGVVEHTGGEPLIGLGELDRSASERVERIRAAIEASGVTAVVPPDVHVRMWSKLVGMAAWACLGAAARASLDELLAVPETRELLAQAMHEVAAVGRARGVALPDAVVAKALEAFGSLKPGTRTSLEHDVEAGHPSELESYSGFVVRAGREAGVATPVHAMLYATLLPRERRVRG